MQAVYIINWSGGVVLMDGLMWLTDNIANVLAVLAAILGIVCFIVAHVERYALSVKFGIPFRMSQAYINDVLDILISAFAVFISGAVLPFVGTFFLFTSVDMNDKKIKLADCGSSPQ